MKEIFDIGLSFAVTRERAIKVTHLVAGGPAAKLGFVTVGDIIVAIDEEAIPADTHADLGAFVQSRGDNCTKPCFAAMLSPSYPSMSLTGNHPSSAVCGPRGTSVLLTLSESSTTRLFDTTLIESSTTRLFSIGKDRHSHSFTEMKLLLASS